MSIIERPRRGKVAVAGNSAARRQLRGRSRVAAAVLLLLWLTGCTGVPYQEMSDARQAVESAEAAVGSMPGPRAQVKDAEALLERAQRHLGARRYDDARQLANEAKSLAIEVRESASQQSP